MLVFKPSQNFLLLLLPSPKISTTTNSKPHLIHHHHHHHCHVKLLHFPPPKAHFKSTTFSSSSSSSPLSPAAEAEPEDSLPPPPPPSAAAGGSVDFLMESGGLSYVEAVQVIRKVPSILKENGDRKSRLVISYLESIGFSKTHISKIISKFPRVIVSDVEKTLKPRIQVFQDFGFSESDIADLITWMPISIMTSGVETRIKPALDLIKSFVKTDEEEEDLIKTIKRNNLFLLFTDPRKSIEPNIHVLRHCGVPDSEISYVILSRLSTLLWTPKVFKMIVKRIVSLGFIPETRKFSNALMVMCGMNKSTWDSKIDLLKGLGWSDEQILFTFRRFSGFLMLSRENLKESIEFFKENLNWDASFLSQHPIILNYSLKWRVIPRFAVFKCLMSKEIIKEDKVFKDMLSLNETKFLSKYVFKYQAQLPYLYEVVYKNGESTNQQDNGDIDMNV